MPSQADELAERVRQFAVRVVKFVRTLPRDPAIDGIARQLGKAATSESANYRAARRGRSRAEFVAKIGLVVEEADESEHWLDVLRETRLAAGTEFDWLLSESRQLRAIFVASATTARANLRKLENRRLDP
jgi:four helix bundle protein